MRKRLTGVVLLLFVGVGLLYGGKLLLPYLDNKKQMATSDGAKTKGRIRIAMDSWVGYYPLCSRKMKSEMHRAGWLLECVDDKADYGARMSGLADGDYEFAVATVDSYLLSGEPYNYPGAVIAVLDESKGGDAILARTDKVANLDAVRDLTGIRIAFTPDSPSHYLLKATADHFDLPGLLPTQKELRIETQGSAKAYSKLMAGTADVAALWEPDVSKALVDPNVVKLLGTEETERLIVDILLGQRDFTQKNPELVSLLLGTYFRVLKQYRDSHDLLQDEIVKETGLGKEAVASMLKGVRWASLAGNCEEWFGIATPGTTGQEQLSHTIYSTADILVNSGDFSSSPIPGGDTYRLINSSFLEDLYTQSIHGFNGSSEVFDTKSTNGKSGFAPLNDGEWEGLSEVGTLKLKPISFRSGSADLDVNASLELDQVVAKISHYPRFRIVVKGHTGTRGDSHQNLLLSQKRADSVADYLMTKHNIEKNRLRAVGFGSSKPLVQKKGEPLRAYQRRLLRVELVLVREDL